jgi:ribosomal protein L19
VRTVIEEEEREKALRSKEYLLGDVRPGDIVEITFQETFESPQTVTHRGLVLSFKRKRSWAAALELAIRFGGMSLKCIYLVHSPKVKKIELVGRGSGCFRANLKHEWQTLNKVQLTTPRIKKRVMKARSFGKKKKTSQRRQSAAVKYDDIKTDTVKRLV